MGTTAGIIVIGNEVLSGKVEDLNSTYLCRELRALGVSVQRVSVLPDDVETIGAEIALFSRSYDLVFTSGGVGPTHDDVTMEGIARGLNRSLVMHPRIEQLIRENYGERVNEAHLKMARVPEGTNVLTAGEVWFPFITVGNIYVFPGVPEILREKFDAIKERFRDSPFFLTTIYVQRGEGAIAEHLNRVVAKYPELLLGSYPTYNDPAYRVKLTLESKDPQYLDTAVADLLTLLPKEAVVRIESRGGMAP